MAKKKVLDKWEIERAKEKATADAYAKALAKVEVQLKELADQVATKDSLYYKPSGDTDAFRLNEAYRHIRAVLSKEDYRRHRRSR